MKLEKTIEELKIKLNINKRPKPPVVDSPTPKSVAVVKEASISSKSNSPAVVLTAQQCEDISKKQQQVLSLIENFKAQHKPSSANNSVERSNASNNSKSRSRSKSIDKGDSREPSVDRSPRNRTTRRSPRHQSGGKVRSRSRSKSRDDRRDKYRDHRDHRDYRDRDRDREHENGRSDSRSPVREHHHRDKHHHRSNGRSRSHRHHRKERSRSRSPTRYSRSDYYSDSKRSRRHRSRDRY